MQLPPVGEAQIGVARRCAPDPSAPQNRQHGREQHARPAWRLPGLLVTARAETTPVQAAATQEAPRLEVAPEDDLHLGAPRGDEVLLAREPPQRERLEPRRLAADIVRVDKSALA